MKEKLLGPCESVGEPPLDERVLSVQRDSAGNAVVDIVQIPWVGMARFKPSHPSVVLQVYE